MKNIQPSDDDHHDGGDGRTSGGGRTPTGILRLDLGKLYSPDVSGRMPNPELKFLSQIEPASPQPSIGSRLSVTFAEDSTSKSFTYTDVKTMDKVHFPDQTQEAEEDSNEEDYSESLKAIINRRASVRRSKKRHGRRGSSPFSPDILPETENGRRRSSVFTTSSGDTGITMEDSYSAGVTQEQIFENIKLHKEVLSNVKMQPWNMRRKLKLVQTAKAYIKKHEGALQERLAQSHSTKDMLARCNIYLVKKLQRLKREMANLSNWLIPWESRIKEIESHFGSVVASYFIFLRWLFWVNIAISSIWVAFATVPELLTADFDHQSERKSILPEDKYNATNFLTLWDFEGVFKYSPMFYGWYTNVTRSEYASGGGGGGYRLPLAYFLTGLAVYIFSFVATLRKMAENSRMSKLSEKEDECIFSWKLFTGWDYMIGNAETATNRVASINMSFKEALLEEAEKKREAQSWKIIGSRVLVNIGVLLLLALSAYAVIQVVARSNDKDATSTTWRRNEITVVMSLITFIFPIFFELLGYFEHYHPRKQLRLQLARIMVLNLLNLYSLIFALFVKIDKMTSGNTNETKSSLYASTTIDPYLSAETPTRLFPLRLEVGNLVREVFANVTQTMAAAWEPAVNATNFYDYVTNTTAELALNYFGNASAETSTTEVTTSEYADNEFGYELDFTQVQDALETLFTTLFTIFDNATTMADNETFYEESLSTFTTLIESTITSTVDYESTSAITPMQPIIHSANTIAPLDYVTRSKLRGLCWETMFGQELVKLTVMDLIMTLLSILLIDFFRGLFVRYMNGCWCWDLEKKFPQYGDFKVAENILHLVNNQGNVWMGMFFSPGLVVINVFKLYIMMYLRSWAVLTCNVPHEVIFRASRSNNFYYALLLMMLFLCVLPVSFAIVWLKPSDNCGPFSGYTRIFHIFTNTLRKELPESTHIALDYIASPGIVIPLLMLLVLIIYYLISLSAALREANNDLKIQLRRERTEERRKMFQIVVKRRRGGSDGSDTNPFLKWRKLLREMPNNKSFDETPKLSRSEAPEAAAAPQLSKFIGRAIKNRKAIEAQPKSEVNDQPDDATDTETHDSLPDDYRPRKSRTKTGGEEKKSRKSAHKRRKDSNTSNWSEVIPVITISKTESAECIIEDKSDCETVKTMKIQKVTSGGNESPKGRYMLKKQPVVDDQEIKKSPRKSQEAKKVFQESSTNTTTETRTEPSTDYRDSTFSN